VISKPKPRPQREPVVAKQAPPPPPPRREEPRPDPKPNLASQIGQVINFGPAIFSKGVLEACQLKCELKFQDSHGNQATGVFFKAGYYSQLKAAPRRVVVTGRLAKDSGGYVIYVQDISQSN
jgi:hypothetical protein